METARSVVRNVMMAFLFVAAIGSTFYAITGLMPSDFVQLNHQASAAKQVKLLSSIQSDRSIKPYNVDLKSSYTHHLSREVSSLPNTLDLNYYPTHKVTATGYTAGTESTGKEPGDPLYGVTYSGVKVRRDFFSTVAADTSIFPIGTILFIPGYGYGVVADTGSAIHGYKLDLYYNSVKDVYKEWGKRMVDVYIIKRGEGHLTEKTLEVLNKNDTVQVYKNLINS